MKLESENIIGLLHDLTQSCQHYLNNLLDLICMHVWTGHFLKLSDIIFELSKKMEQEQEQEQEQGKGARFSYLKDRRVARWISNTPSGQGFSLVGLTVKCVMNRSRSRL